MVSSISRVSIKDLAIHIEGIAVFASTHPPTQTHVHLLKYYYFGMMCIDRLILWMPRILFHRTTGHPMLNIWAGGRRRRVSVRYWNESYILGRLLPWSNSVWLHVDEDDRGTHRASSVEISHYWLVQFVFRSFAQSIGEICGAFAQITTRCYFYFYSARDTEEGRQINSNRSFIHSHLTLIPRNH